MRLALALVLGLVAGCGGGGGSGGSSSSSSSTGGDPTDAALAGSFAAAGVTPVPRLAAESPEIVALGRALFFDKVLSGNRNISCATCHAPGLGTGDALPVSLGEGSTGPAPARALAGGQLIPRNSQPLLNAGIAGMHTMFWDGRVRRDPATGELRTPELLLDGRSPGRPRIVAQLTSALAAQAMFPVVTPEEMRGQPGSNELASAVTNEDVWTRLMARLVGTSNGTVGGIAGYRTLFRAAYPAAPSLDDLSFGHAARAIAAFERDAFTALDAPLDRYLAGDAAALSPSAKRGGLVFFGRGRCASCHSGPLLSDLGFHALAAPQLGPGKFEPNDDRGRFNVSGLAVDAYAFRTPPLRNVARTGPWMHDGAFATLEGAVRHHLDPAGSVARYSAALELPPLFAPTLDTDAARRAARLGALDAAVRPPPLLSDAEVADLLQFLDALTDPVAAAPRVVAPASVPSGLGVGD